MARDRPRRGLATSVGCALLVLAGCGGGGGGGGSAPPAAAPPPPESSVPAPSWTLERTAPADLEVSAAAVDAVLDHVFTDEAVQSAVLVDRGHVVGERYADGYDAESYGTSWSVAKSIYSAAVGVAVDAGDIASVEQPATDFLSEWIGTDKEGITVRDILEMRSGYPADVSIFTQEDQSAFALEVPLANEPGTRFVYSNPNSQLMGLLLQRATGADAHTYLSRQILARHLLRTQHLSRRGRPARAALRRTRADRPHRRPALTRTQQLASKTASRAPVTAVVHMFSTVL